MPKHWKWRHAYLHTFV